MNNRIKILDLGRMDYKPSWDFQKNFHQDVLSGKENDTLILVEHEPVYTLGKNANKEHLLDKSNSRVKVYNVERGGDITFHGPGQLVGYRLSGHGLLHAVLVIGGWVSQQHISNTLGVRNRCWRLRHLELDVGHVVGDDVVAAGHHKEWPGQQQQGLGKPHHWVLGRDGDGCLQSDIPLSRSKTMLLWCVIQLFHLDTWSS